ncbi:MAG: crotonase/enoyl-CoA hydratase family protein [Myxococcales bacterium]|nr:crotonase/enoyl-CoA hydratase family protein [Myxococcales bacterium]MDH3842633.1 crotonase/enoyl-CoA hydratase family protein [Myxococcales bacterium]
MGVTFETNGHIASITLDRPEARNAINGEMASGIESALDRYEKDDALWAAILKANGPVFCAGADLKEIAAGNVVSLSTKKGGFAGITKRERTKPVIAAVTGSALAGGTEIALACDMIICSDKTMFGLPEVKRSLVAAAGGLFRLPRAIGMAPALEVIMTGDPLSAQRAYELGMVNKVVPEAQVVEEALKLADRVATNAPLAVQASRRVAVRAFIDADDALWRVGYEATAQIMNTEDFKEGPRAFIEKRPPNWQGK